MSSNTLRNIVLGIVMLILLSIQASNVLAIAGVFPDLVLIMVILASFHLGEFKGEIFGFSMGLLVDALSGGLFGLTAFLYTLFAWFTYIFKKYFQASDIVAFIIYIILITIFKYILSALFLWLFKSGALLDWGYILKMGGEVVYNSIIAALFYYITPWLFKREVSDF